MLKGGGGGENLGLGEGENHSAPPLYTSLQYILVGVVEVNKILYVSGAINACSYGSNIHVHVYMCSGRHGNKHEVKAKTWHLVHSNKYMQVYQFIFPVFSLLIIRVTRQHLSR